MRQTNSGAEHNGVLFGVCFRTGGPNKWPSVRLLPNSDSVRRSVGPPPAATLLTAAASGCALAAYPLGHGWAALCLLKVRDSPFFPLQQAGGGEGAGGGGAGGGNPAEGGAGVGGARG